MKEISEGVWKDGNRLYTKNLAPGKKVYNERLVKENGTEFREWNPERSKLGAAIANGMKNVPFGRNSVILYLGASTGTTVSHVSDICCDGIVYALEFAERVFRSLLELAEHRKNVAPLLADVRKPETYSWMEECDAVFCDIADPQETDIFIRNCELFLKKNGYGMMAIKSQSIDVTKKPEEVYQEEVEKIVNAGYDVIEVIDLEPYEKCHSVVLIQKT